MYIRKSKIHRETPIGELPKGRVRLTCGGPDTVESIWVAKDEQNKVMYLLNHALCFYPFPSWGMELPLQSSIDVLKYRGDSPDETDITVCEETCEALKEFINDKDEFDCGAFIEKQKELGGEPDEQ